MTMSRLQLWPYGLAAEGLGAVLVHLQPDPGLQAQYFHMILMMPSPSKKILMMDHKVRS